MFAISERLKQNVLVVLVHERLNYPKTDSAKLKYILPYRRILVKRNDVPATIVSLCTEKSLI